MTQSPQLFWSKHAFLALPKNTPISALQFVEGNARNVGYMQLAFHIQHHPELFAEVDKVKARNILVAAGHVEQGERITLEAS